MKKCILLFFCTVLLSGCKKKQESITTCTDSESLYSQSKFPIGVAIDIDALLEDSLYKKIAAKQFNSITPENIFKPSFIHPGQNSYDFTLPDFLSDFCSTHHKRLHGHTLIWHEQLPAWIWQFEGSQKEWEQLMKDHIQTIVKHFKGKVKSWDVVNEAFEMDGTLRNSIWKQKVGDTYIEKAFIFAHEADPEAILFYNDFILEMDPDKRKNVLQYFDRLRQRGIKVDGIGLQMHVTTSYPETEQVSEALKEIYDKKYKIHLSEIDISVNPFGKNIEPSTDLLNEQATILSAFVHQYKNIPLEYQYGMTFWGISDKNSWLRTKREDYPLLYDDTYLPKPAYCKLKESL